MFQRRVIQAATRTTVAAPEALRDQIAQVAYELFEQRGRQHGHDLEDWLEAERIVRVGRRAASQR